MTILLTGATGNTATYLARQLQTAKVPFIATSRKGKLSNVDLQDVPVAELDYQDVRTFDKPFEHPTAVSSPIHAIYLVIPPGAETDPINAFVDHAVKQWRVSRVVLLGGQGPGIDAPYPPSRVWAHLSKTDVDYAVLQPSWFNENLFKMEFLQDIQKDGKFYSAAANGKIGWIAVEDIAAVAFAVLTSHIELKGQSILILGPELVTLDEVAERMSRILGRKIEHVQLSQVDRCMHLQSLGLSEERAKFLSFLEVMLSRDICAQGFPSDSVRRLTGHAPQDVSAWIAKHKERFV